jgi:hypothetical protein
MVKQKKRYGKWKTVSQGLIGIYLRGRITSFACQDLASHIKISQITFFSYVFLGEKTIKHGEKKHRYVHVMAVIQGLFFIYWYGSIGRFASQDLASHMKIWQFEHFCCVLSTRQDPFAW